tara:strand:- start:183 stop:1331 length:1149 start_codon:yes stop_codon:yes gene_type:complete
MNLFQKLLVVGCGINLLAPIASASEMYNLEAMNGYKRSAKKAKRFDSNSFDNLVVSPKINLDGQDVSIKGVEAGSFSETTTMKGKLEALFAAQNTDAGTVDGLMLNYHLEVDLNTSFTGEDKLNIELAAGNQDANSVAALTDPLGETSETLHMEDVNYTFPLVGWKVAVGDSMDASKTWPNACSYDNVIDNMGDCGASNSVDLGGDVSLSAARSFDNGWAFGLGVSADDGETASGVFTDEGDDRFGVALGYENDTYGITVAYTKIEDGAANNAYIGTTAFYSLKDFMISGGYEIMKADLTADQDSHQWTLGVSTEFGPGEISAGIGTNGAIDEDADDLMVWETKYSYPINDSMTLDTFAYVAETAAGTDDNTGVGFLTTFKF